MDTLRGRRRWRRARIALLVTLLAAALLLEGSIVTGPVVGTAPTMVTVIDRAHRTRPQGVAPTEHIAVAVIAAEDETFYSNDGVDLSALLRAGWGYLRGSDAGGSTIEIQLAHRLYPAETSGLWGRVHRVTLALQLDTHFTKTAILSMYLSAVYFGHGYYGIAAASRGYFGVAVAALNWTQAALLAGVVQAPSALDPVVHPAAARQRMGYVLDRLVAEHQLTELEAREVAASPFALRARPA